MGDAPEQEACEGDVDHGFGTIDTLLIVADETAPSGHPSEGAFYDPATWKDFEAFGRIGPSNDLDGEVEEGCLVHEPGAVVGAIGKEMLEPWPTFADAVEDHLGAGAVGDIGSGEVDHKQAAIGVHGDVALAPDDLLAGVVTSCFCFWSLDRLAVDDAARRARLAPGPLAVEHQHHVVDRLEHQAPDE